MAVCQQFSALIVIDWYIKFVAESVLDSFRRRYTALRLKWLFSPLYYTIPIIKFNTARQYRYIF